ncbi:MAG: ZrgA family zinc uptake protein [Pseudobdellovibrionaceae bacterium]
MTKFVALFLVLVSTTVYAGKKNEHRHHEAHVHGGATLSIAFDQLKGKVEFKAASEGVLGFEHEAKSEKDKKKLNDTIAKFETSIGSMVKFDESAGCTFVKEKIEMAAKKEENDAEEKEHKEHKGEHSDFIANFSVDCKKDIKSTKVTFDFSQFKGLKDLDVTLLVGDLQKSVEIKRKPVTIELK